MTRLRSDMTISSIRRQVQAQGGYCTVLHSGHEEAGIIFLLHRHKSTLSLWAETSNMEGARGWACRASAADELEVLEKIRKERAFDPDIWVLEIENVNLEEVVSEQIFSE